MKIAGSPEIEAHFQAPIPPLLWHYTAKNSLQSILVTRSMWATDARYLNDSQEFTNWHQFLNQYVNKRQVNPLGPAARTILNGVIKALPTNSAFSFEGMSLYILCFSEAEDELTQWRYYGDDNRGCSLGFDLSGIRPPMGTDSAVRFAPCIYDDERKHHLITTAADSFLTAFEEMQEQVGSSLWIDEQISREAFIRASYGGSFRRSERSAFIQARVKQLLMQARLSWSIDMFSLATHFKHKAFASEREWRLSLPGERGLSSAIHARKRLNGSGRTVEYVDVPLVTPQGKLPLRQLFVGHCADSEESFHVILTSHTYEVEMKTRSQIPVACS